MESSSEVRAIRKILLEEIEHMEIEHLKRIAYEMRCKENNIAPDETYTNE